MRKILIILALTIAVLGCSKKDQSNKDVEKTKDDIKKERRLKRVEKTKKVKTLKKKGNLKGLKKGKIGENLNLTEPIYFGSWKPGKVLTFTQVSAMGFDSYKDFTKKHHTFKYSKDSIFVGKENLKNPIYRSEKKAKNKVCQEWGIDCSKLKIKSNVVKVITVLEKKDSEWINPGATLLIDMGNRERMISIWDGGVFEIVKK